MTQLMPLLLTVSCFSKIQIGLPFWYRLTWVVPEKGPLNSCLLNWLIQYYLNNTTNLRHLTQRIISCYTHSDNRIVTIDFLTSPDCTSVHFVVTVLLLILLTVFIPPVIIIYGCVLSVSMFEPICTECKETVHVLFNVMVKWWFVMTVLKGASFSICTQDLHFILTAW